ncbi:hypothetical protein IT568_03150 [bacterium]|nr:hypothetical protein [bacterium]
MKDLLNDDDDYVHADQHVIIQHPTDHNTFFIGCDGGVFKTTDDFDNFTTLNNGLAVLQIVGIGIEQSSIYENLICGSQDNGVLRFDGSSWRVARSGDGGFCEIDYTDPQKCYSEYVNFTPMKSENFGCDFDNKDDGISYNNATIKVADGRTNFYSPLVLHPTNPAVLYGGTYRIWRTNNAMDNWNAISGDLTKGGTAVISAIAVSPTEIHRIYTGANDGRVCRTDNQYGTVSVPGGSSLVDITGNLPAKNVTSIAIDPYDSGTIYVTFSSFNNNSNIGFVFKSTNADTSVGTAVVWQNITPTLSGGTWNLPVNSVALDGNNIYIGTDLGVFFSNNSGNTWQQFNDNLPKVSVSQLRINYFTGYLYAATIGRGVWKTQLSRPDLVHEFPTTWTDAIVPKTTSDALFDDCVVSNELTSNSSSTFINFAIRNAGIGESGGHTNKLFLDRVPISTQSIGDGLPSGTRTLNKGPFEVRGGRHTIADSIDVGNIVPESNETNNYYQRQFIWEPKPLALVSSIQRDAPPIKGNGINPNCDGFSYKYPSGTFAFGIALLPTAANPSGDTEVDLTLYEDYYSSQSGFSNAYGFSWLPNTESDFVLGTWNAVNDKNADGYSEFYPAVHGDLMSNYLYSTNSSPFQIQTTNSAGNLITSYPTTKTGENIVPEQILKLYEVYLSSGTAYQFLLTNVSGNADLGISIFTPGCGPICGKTEAVAVSDANGNGGNENLVYQAPISDWFMLAVWKKDTEDLTKDAFYDLNFRIAPANLLTTTPTGWDSSIVARNDNLATSTSCFVSSSLNGNAAFSTYLNLGIRNSMLNTADPSNLKIYVDDVFAKTIPVGTVSGSTTVTLNNLLLEQEIKGGRHTILDSLDVENSVEETNETDNFAARQFVWSPYFVPLNYALSRTAPPNPTSIGATFYNCDGFLNNLTPSHWSAIGILPVNSGDDYDVRLYNDYTGSTTGFATPLVQSAFGSGSSDFVVVNTYVASGGNHYVGVSNSNSGTGNFTFYASQGNDLLLNNFANGPFSIGASEVARVFEIDLISGSTYHFILKTLSGNADLAFSLYDFADFDGLFSKSEAIAFANSSSSGDENFSLTAGVSGRFGLVVWKNSATDLFLENSFEILVSDTPLHAVNLKIIGLLPSLTTNVTFTRLGTPQTQSVSGTFANYADNLSYLEVQNPVNLTLEERFSSADQTNWVLTSSLVDTVNYAFRQFRNTFTPSVASGGTALGSGNTAVLVRTYNGALSGAMLDGSADVWVDENGTAEFLHITSGSTSSERWKLGESSASLSFGTITGSGNLYTATFYNQLKPSVTLNGTASTNTANVVSRISFGVSSPQSGVFGVWSEFCDRGTVLAFSDTTSLGWSTTDLVSGTVTDSFSGTINYVGSVLPAVSDLEIERVGNDLVLNWSAVSGATSYRIYGSSMASVLPLAVNFIATVTGTSYTHVGAVSLGMFYYVVTSDNTTVTVSKQQNQNFEK